MKDQNAIQQEAEKRYPMPDITHPDNRKVAQGKQEGFEAGANLSYTLAQQEGQKGSGETLVASSDYAKLQEEYNQLKKAFEELLSQTYRHTAYIDIKENWRTKAGLSPTTDKAEG